MSSYPSKKITIGDVKEIKDFRAEFIYNFFVPSERVRSGDEDVPSEIKTKVSDAFESARIDKISRFLPRYIRFDYTPIVSQPVQGVGNEFISEQDTSRSGNSRRHYDAARIMHLLRSKGMISEEELSNRLYTSLNFQDDTIDNKLRTFVSGSIAKRITAHNRSKQNEIEDQRELIIDRLGAEHSLLSAGRALYEQVSQGVVGSNNLIIDAMAHIDNLQAQFIDSEQQRVIEDRTFASVRDVSIKAQFNNKVIGQVVTNIVNDPMSPFSDEFKQLKSRANKIEVTSRDAHNSNIIADTDYDTMFNAIDTIAGDASDHHSRSRIVGYLIEKFELPTRGARPITHQPIIVPDPRIGTAIDIDVKYGSTYVYTIRALVEIELKAIDDDGEGAFAFGLVSSRQSRRVTIVCDEKVPPTPPADFNIIWDYKQKLPVLMWAFPTNPQRDIKRFQVFRRASVEEPYQLLKEFDFDDSWTKVPRVETPRRDLVEVNMTPVLRFVDQEFRKDSTFIYALCSIDAHDISSNYSLQYRVSFDRFKNRLVKEIVSYSGAPKSYPNMMLNVDMFQDTIKDSGHARMKIYFDPETIEIEDPNGSRSNLFVTGEGKKYRLQMINIDVQKQDVLDIRVADNRNDNLRQTPDSLCSGFGPSKTKLADLSRGRRAVSPFRRSGT